MPCENYTPITIEQLAENAGASIEETQAFIDDEFGSYENYVAVCNSRVLLDMFFAIRLHPEP